jgi:hypothetical protein
VLDRFCHAPSPSLPAGSKPKAKSRDVEWRFRGRVACAGTTPPNGLHAFRIKA